MKKWEGKNLWSLSSKRVDVTSLLCAICNVRVFKIQTTFVCSRYEINYIGENLIREWKAHSNPCREILSVHSCAPQRSTECLSAQSCTTTRAQRSGHWGQEMWHKRRQRSLAGLEEELYFTAIRPAQAEILTWAKVGSPGIEGQDHTEKDHKCLGHKFVFSPWTMPKIY